MSDAVFDYVYLFLAMAIIAATSLFVITRVHGRAGGLIAITATCTAAVAILLNFICFFFGSLPLNTIPTGFSASGISGAVTGLLISLAKLLPFPSLPPKVKSAIRDVLYLLALILLLFTANFTITPLLAPW